MTTDPCMFTTEHTFADRLAKARAADRADDAEHAALYRLARAAYFAGGCKAPEAPQRWHGLSRLRMLALECGATHPQISACGGAA